mgnify:FL=1
MQCVFIARAGFGFGCLMSSVMTLIGGETPERSVAAATSLMMVASNVFTFFCSAWMSAVGSLTGDATFMPLKIGTVIYLILAVVLLVRPLSTQKNNAQ